MGVDCDVSTAYCWSSSGNDVDWLCFIKVAVFDWCISCSREKLLKHQDNVFDNHFLNSHDLYVRKYIKVIEICPEMHATMN